MNYLRIAFRQQLTLSTAVDIDFIHHHALAVVSIDANSTLRIEISAANELDWQLDARITGGSVEVSRIFCEGDSVRDDDVPDWVERVAGVVGERLDGGP